MIDFEYQLKRSKRAISSTTISIKPDGRVIVSAPPWVPRFVIMGFLEQKSDWVKDKLSRIKPIQTKSYQDSDLLSYFGKGYPLNLISTDTMQLTTLDHDGFSFNLKISNYHSPEKRQQEIKKVIEKWYLQNGVGVITEKTNLYAQKIGVTYKKITLKNVSSIWGSCSIRNNLNFNRKLIMAPIEVAEYVIIHELCHIIHRNHSSRFWALVRQYDPKYQQHRLWLRQNSHLLTL